MLYNPVNVFGGIDNGYTFRMAEALSDNSIYKFRNGTFKTVANTATMMNPSVQLVSSFTSGRRIFDAVLENPKGTKNPLAPVKSTNSYALSSDLQLMKNLGYPNPILISEDNSVAGFFIDSQTDVAILNINGFVRGQTQTSSIDFQNTVESFLAKCKQEGKKPLIVDVRGNAGGTIYTGYDIFKQIFPSMQAPSAVRFRNHPAFEAMGKVASTLQLPVMNIVTDGPMEFAASFNPKAYSNGVDGPSFAGWSDYVPPIHDHGDNFTSTFSWKFTDEALSLYYSNGIQVTGYGSRSKPAQQVFEKDNVVIVSTSILRNGIFID
jgi:Peptidase family S41